MSATTGKKVPELHAGSDSTIDMDHIIRGEILNAETHEVEAVASWMELIDAEHELTEMEKEPEKKGLRSILERLLHKLE